MPETPLPTMPIDEQTLVTRNTGVVAAPVHDEIVMMDVQSGLCYGLDNIGSVIWKRLEQPRTFGALVDDLAAEFDAERGVIAADVRKLLSIMAEHKVISFA